ncbi:MAG: histidine phosphatase family protein [Acidobacteriota bacterium]
MSILLLVRHGQASLHGDDYDVLSPLGEAQCRELGRFWLDLGLRFDRVVIGPRRRHRQSHDEVATLFREAGLPWPEAEFLPELDEHHGPQVLDAQRDSLDPNPVDSADDGNFMTRYLRLFRLGMSRWASGDLETPEPFEDWRGFRDRVARGVDLLCDPGERTGHTVAFTSGGFVAAALGHVLDLDDRRVLELSFGMRNASVSEVRFSPERGRGVVGVNQTPFRDPSYLTFV